MNSMRSTSILISVDIWQRPLRRSSRRVDGNQLRFEIPYARVMPSDSLNTNVKKFIIYDVSIGQSQTTTADGNPEIIERRYTDFRLLYDALRKHHAPLLAGCQFPKKVMMGNFSTDLIAERSAMFELFLDHVAASALLRESPEFLHFLQGKELTKACQLLDERRNEQAIPMLESCFRLLNKVRTDDILIQ